MCCALSKLVTAEWRSRIQKKKGPDEPEVSGHQIWSCSSPARRPQRSASRTNGDSQFLRVNKEAAGGAVFAPA